MIDFIRYCVRYFTHYTPIQVPKKNLLKPDHWYSLVMMVKLKGKESYIDELRMMEVKDED